MKKIIGLTGGIASGKSTALKIIKDCGYTVLSADEIYKKMLDNQLIVALISKEMNIEPIKDGDRIILDKQKLSNLIFDNKENLTKLNCITHPLIMQEMLRQAKAEKSTVVCEVPLLFEGKFENIFDDVIVIFRDRQQRINSASKRDNKSIAEIEKIMQNQINWENFTPNEHTITINNDGDIESLKAKVISAIEKLEKNN